MSRLKEELLTVVWKSTCSDAVARKRLEGGRCNGSKHSNACGDGEFDHFKVIDRDLSIDLNDWR